MNNINIKGKSSDWHPSGDFKVEGIYSKVINLSCKRRCGLSMQGPYRYSLITDENDFQPRSAVVEALPELKMGETIFLDLSKVPDLYNPYLEKTTLNKRWRNFWNDWTFFLTEEPLNELLPYLEDIAGLIGVGSGFTPSGDDFICGFAAAKRHAGEYRENFFYEISKALEKTTWLSGSMVYDACRGLIWKRGKDLCKALSEDSSEEMIKKTGNIINWGHTSGKAWLAGFSLGLECCEVDSY